MVPINGEPLRLSSSTASAAVYAGDFNRTGFAGLLNGSTAPSAEGSFIPKMPETGLAVSISVVTIRLEARSLRDAQALDDFDIRIFLRDVFTAFDAVNNGLNRRAVHQQHFLPFAAHLAEQIFAGGFAGPMALVMIRVSAPGGAYRPR